MNGFGTTLGYGDAGINAPTLIGQILKITPTKGTVKDVNFVPLDSSDKHTIHLPGSLEGGEVALNLPYGAAIRHTVETLRGLLKFWTVILPDFSWVQFQGHVSEIGEEEIGADSLLTTALKIKVRGKPEFIPTLVGVSTVTTQSMDGNFKPIARDNGGQIYYVMDDIWKLSYDVDHSRWQIAYFFGGPHVWVGTTNNPNGPRGVYSPTYGGDEGTVTIS
jgi:hypothetical protein